MNSQTAFFLPVILYLVATLFYLAHLTRKKEIIEKIGSYVLVSACLVHLVATLFRYIEAGYTPITNLHESLSFFALCTAVFFLYLRKTYRIPGLGSIVLPVVSIMVIWALALPSPIKPLPPVLQSYWLPIHTGLAFIGDAIFLVGCLVSIIYLLAERDIKKKGSTPFSGASPHLKSLTG